MLLSGQDILIVIIGSVLLSESVDAFVYPRRIGRSSKFFLLRFIPVLISTSFFLVISGSILVSLILSGLLLFVLVIGSNIKLKILNEPLVFTDFALLSYFFKYPKFYIQVVELPLRVCIFVVLFLFCILFYFVFSLDIILRLEGICLGVIAAFVLWLSLRLYGKAEGVAPHLWHDTYRLGLLPTLLLYAYRWRHLPPLPKANSLPEAAQAPESVIVIQCESLADPAQLNDHWSALSELERSKTEAIQWGDLLPSGLGAYTMRSEYSVLCGDSDEILSYRQFDPFLTAYETPSHGLAHKLKKQYKKAFFVHPYDLRFYGRHRLMPRLGFTELVGQEAFSQKDKKGPYVSDEALAQFLCQHIREESRFFTYCVTIENHGPWKKGRLGQETGADAWYAHVQHSNEMLKTVRKAVQESGKDILLVFFGDHRPALESFPVQEGLARNTPYIILRPNAPDTASRAQQPMNITPSELHHVILDTIMS